MAVVHIGDGLTGINGCWLFNDLKSRAGFVFYSDKRIYLFPNDTRGTFKSQLDECYSSSGFPIAIA